MKQECRVTPASQPPETGGDQVITQVKDSLSLRGKSHSTGGSFRPLPFGLCLSLQVTIHCRYGPTAAATPRGPSQAGFKSLLSFCTGEGLGIAHVAPEPEQGEVKGPHSPQDGLRGAGKSRIKKSLLRERAVRAAGPSISQQQTACLPWDEQLQDR